MINTETDRGVLEANRLILAHFDSYSTALLFARWPNGSLLSPVPLPASAALTTAPAEASPLHTAQAAIDAGVTQLGLDAAEFVYAGDFDAWASSDEGDIRIHLLRFTTFEAPTHRVEPGGGVFRPISALRGANPQELQLVRKVFDLIMGGGGR